MFVIAAGLFTLDAKALAGIGGAAIAAAWAIETWVRWKFERGETTLWLTSPERWSPEWFVLNGFVNGTHPILPWLAFLCAGIVLGRLLLERSGDGPATTALRWRIAALGGGLFAVATLGRTLPGDDAGRLARGFVSTDPFDRGGLYVASALGTALVAYAVLDWAAERLPAMTATAAPRRAAQPDAVSRPRRGVRAPPTHRLVRAAVVRGDDAAGAGVLGRRDRRGRGLATTAGARTRRTAVSVARSMTHRGHPGVPGADRDGPEPAASEHFVEGGATVRVAGVEPPTEPRLTLLRRAVGQRLRDRRDPASLLDPVVADGARPLQRLVDLRSGVELVATVSVVRPHSGEAVGLQLECDRVSVRVLGVLLLELVHLGVDAEHVLDVVAVLVGDDVLRGEVARRPEALLELRRGSRGRSTPGCRPGSRTARSATTPARTRCW